MIKYSVQSFIIFIGTLKTEIQNLRDKRMYPAGPAVIKTALDKLTPPVVPGEELDSDSSGNGTRFAKRTGIFELDFPSDNTKPKLKGNGKKSAPKHPRLDTVNEDLEPQSPRGSSSDNNDSHTSIGTASGTLFTSDISPRESTDVPAVKPQTKRLIKKGIYVTFWLISTICLISSYVFTFI